MHIFKYILYLYQTYMKIKQAEGLRENNFALSLKVVALS